MSKPIFYIHIQGRGVRGEVRLNDAPVLALSLDYPQDAFPTISEWVINGDNELSVHIQDSDESAQLHISLCEGEIGDVPDPDAQVPLARIDWPPLSAPSAGGADSDEADSEEDSPIPVPPIPPVLTVTGQASHNWGEWTWQVSPPFASDASTVTAVTSWIRDLHGYLAAGRIDALTGHSSVKFNEVAPIYDMSATEAEERIQHAWAYFQSQTGWELAPFDENDLDLRLRCDGKLVEPCTRDGQPVIRQRHAIEGERWSLPIFLARSNWGVVTSQLAIVR